jgi:hypothetical protein
VTSNHMAMPRVATAPPPLVLAPSAAPTASARGAAIVLECLHEVVAAYVEGWHEGPGALVPRDTWMSAVRRLADDLLAPAADRKGRIAVGPLSDRARRPAEALYGEDPPTPMADRPPWTGRLLVVLGCGRSGTTWLERMLLASPDAGGPDGAESFLFKLTRPLWERLPELAPVCDREQVIAALRRFYDAIFEEALALESPEARVFIEKTPMHSLMVGEIAAIYPRAHYLHLVRDGRDVARSMSQVEFFGVPDPADAARGWRMVLHRVRGAAPGLRYYREVRYEDLLADPVEGTLDLLAWAGMRHDAAIVPELTERAATRVSSHAGTSQAVGTGTWRLLDRADLHRMLGECGDQLVREGYLSRRGLVRATLSRAYWSRRGPRLRARVESALRLR